MSMPTKDGAWITASRVVKIECTKCGQVSVSKYPMNDRELDDAIREHARQHGGLNRY